MRKPILDFNGFNLLLKKGELIAELHEDKLFKALLRNMGAFVNLDEGFELDFERALKALRQKKEDYKERTEFLEELLQVVSKSQFTQTFLWEADRSFLIAMIHVFSTRGTIVNFKRFDSRYVGVCEVS
jgi:hypothetical protein